MKLPILPGFCIILLFTAAACAPTWNHKSGVQTLPASHKVSPSFGVASGSNHESAAAGELIVSRPVSFFIPAGWHWFQRGDDLIATKDGVFLQHLFIERLHISQTDQPVSGAFPLAALSSKQWPIRTARNLKKRFMTGMTPAEAAEALLESRRNDPAVTDLAVRKIVTRTIAGQQAFWAVFDFRLREVKVPFPRYRTIYCGFLLDDWFYGFSYTAAERYYFARDVEAFETFLESVQLADR